MRPFPLVIATVALAVLASGCRGEASASAPTPSAPAATAATAKATTAAPVPTASPTPTRLARPTKVAAPKKIKPTKPAYDVKAVKRQLIALHYFVAAPDGTYTSALKSAVMAFQKVNEIGVDGTIGPITLGALKAPKAPKLRDSSPADRVEVDLTRQVLYIVKGGKLARILPVSSGSGVHYLTKSGKHATALTPVGHYKIQRRIVGVREADLGTLYDPEYFYQGWAIHGSNSVPSYPASHGCIRVTRTDGTWLLGQIKVGTAVHVYGGKYVFRAGSQKARTVAPGA